MQTVSNDGWRYTAANPFRSSTKYLTSQTGLYYYGYRYYLAEIGRWLSRDPVYESEIYRFVSNDSINSFDVMGLLDDKKTLKYVKWLIDEDKVLRDGNVASISWVADVSCDEVGQPLRDGDPEVESFYDGDISQKAIDEYRDRHGVIWTYDYSVSHGAKENEQFLNNLGHMGKVYDLIGKSEWFEQVFRFYGKVMSREYNGAGRVIIVAHCACDKNERKYKLQWASMDSAETANSAHWSDTPGKALLNFHDKVHVTDEALKQIQAQNEKDTEELAKFINKWVLPILDALP